MKTRLFLFALVAIVFSSCVPEQPSGPNTPSGGNVTLSSASTLTLGAAGGSVDIVFTASGDWTAAPANDRADWLSLSPAKGSAGEKTVTVSVNPNDTYNERSAAIRINCGSATASVNVVQKQKDALTQTASKTRFGPEGGSFTIEVRSNVEYTFEISGNWIHQATTKAMTSKVFTFTVDANDDSRKREGSVTIKSSLGSETITVYQDAGVPSIILSADNVPVKTEGGTFSVDVNTNVDVTMSITEGAEWLSEVQTRSMSTHTYTFQAAANESPDTRIGRITFRNTTNGVEASVTVTQMQKDALVVAQSLYEIGAAGGNIVIEASANIEIEVSASESWVQEAVTKSMTTQYFNFNVEANHSYVPRECTITFTASKQTPDSPFTQPSPWSIIGTIGGDYWTRDIEMKTDGKWHAALGVSVVESDEFKFRKDGSWTVNLGSNTYNVTSYPGDCLAILEQNGGNMKLPAGTFDIYLNPEKKQAYLLTAGTPFAYDGYSATKSGLSQTVTIRQDGADGFIADFKEQYNLSSKSQALELRLRSSVEIVAESKCNWVDVVGTKAMTSMAVSLQILANTSQESRVGEVVVSAPSLGISQTVKIVQAGQMYIPDPVFYSWLLEKFDTSGDGSLSDSECDAVIQIDLLLGINKCIESVRGLEYFPNLKYLTLHWNSEEGSSPIAEMDLSGNPELLKLDLAKMHELKSITFNCPKLSSLYITHAPALQSLDISQFESLSYLSLKNTCHGLTKLDLSSNKQLMYLTLYSIPAIQKVIAPSLKLQLLSVNECPALAYSDIILPDEDFSLRDLSINTIESFPEEIDLSMCPELKSVLFSSCSSYWKISTIWLREGITTPDLSGYAKDAEIRYKGNNVYAPLDFASPAFKNLLMSYGNGYYDINQDGAFSEYELKKIDYFAESPEYLPLYEKITTLEDLAYMPNLRVFGLMGYEEKVSAPIPEALKSLTKLESFYMDNCRIQGTLPEWLADMPALKELSLYQCYPIGGEIPSRFIVGNKFTYINLSECDFNSSTFVVPGAYLMDYESEYYNHEGYYRLTPQHSTVRRETNSGGDYVYDTPVFLYQSDVDGTGAVHPDGETVLYHAATEGPGIDLIITGDGFSAENNTVGGTLETYMKACAEQFLHTEPYNKLAQYYNIWLVYAHSRTPGTGVYSNSCTKFGCIHTNPGHESTVSGNHSNIKSYMDTALGKDCKNAVIAVLMNSMEYGGTCYFQYYSLNDWVYTIAYIPVFTKNGGFMSAFTHETLGHGIAKLADEYDASSANPDSYPSTYPYWVNLGIYANVDNVSDPATIRWNKFLSDSRYSEEKLGVFEGANYANTGWYRPSYNSVMRNPNNDGGDHFNAPSRESAYQWTLFRVYGGGQNWPDWPTFLSAYYNYESFVAFDKAPSPYPAPASVHKAHHAPKKIVLSTGKVVENKLPPLTPPVFLTEGD